MDGNPLEIYWKSIGNEVEIEVFRGLVAVLCHSGEHGAPELLLVVIVGGRLLPAHMFEGREHQFAAEVLLRKAFLEKPFPWLWCQNAA